VTIFNVYLSGVGGQGIGLISEIIMRAADHAGQRVKSVDTHGLAQRGGIVVSQVRLGSGVQSPLIPAGQADLAVCLERHEALRAAATMLKPKGTLIFYDTVWQPLPVRLNQAAEVTVEMVQALGRERNVTVRSVYRPDLPDIRMQNMAVLADVCRHRLIPDIDSPHYRTAMTDLMAGNRLEINLALFDRCALAGTP
jgi:indolepyruvate ferredoxin oxidoreductase beta subunit